VLYISLLQQMRHVISCHVVQSKSVSQLVRQAGGQALVKLSRVELNPHWTISTALHCTALHCKHHQE
jgi:hypothetical protein